MFDHCSVAVGMQNLVLVRLMFKFLFEVCMYVVQCNLRLLDKWTVTSKFIQILIICMLLSLCLITLRQKILVHHSSGSGHKGNYSVLKINATSSSFNYCTTRAHNTNASSWYKNYSIIHFALKLVHSWSVSVYIQQESLKLVYWANT